MDFLPSAKSQWASSAMWKFMVDEIFPAETVWQQHLDRHGPHATPPIIETLKESAKVRGLWNLFLPKLSGLSNADYAPIAEVSGWSPVIAPEAINCQAPDTGNMEILDQFGSPDQKRQWLEPLLEGKIRSAFAMTEPDVASSDATNISTEIRRHDNRYVLNGRKWFVSGVADERCKVFIVMGKTDSSELKHARHSMILVPRDTPGVSIERHLPILGFQDQHGHSEITFRDVQLPIDTLLGNEGDGFLIAQSRLGPGRIHHAMRAIGMAERALALLVTRARERKVFGKKLAEYANVQDTIADCRIQIDEARLHVLHTAWKMDETGVRDARGDIAAIKVAVPAMATAVIDRAMEIFGAMGLSDDTPLASLYAWARALRVVDGPDAVHRRTVALLELRRPHPYEG